jgi:signal peptidase II
MAVLHQQRPWLWGRLSPLGLGVALLIVVIDQLHKYWMLVIYAIQSKVRVVVTPFLDLVFVKNTGISYGLLLQETREGQWLLAGFAGLAVVAMACWLARGVSTRLVAVSLGLVMGGAASNAVDRVTLGGVADFFSLHAFGFRWYVFNLADVAIVAGVLGLLYDSFGPSRKDASKAL